MTAKAGLIGESNQQHLRSSWQATSASASDHCRLMAAGWSYRMNDRGWIIYHGCRTGRWYAREDALAMLDDRAVETHKR